MSRRHPRDSRTVSEYPPAHHLSAPSFTAFAITAMAVLTVVTVVSYPVLSVAVATALVGVFAAVRTVVARIERETVNVHLPGLPVRVTFARTAGD